MNRFEQAVYDCMIPTAELLERTTVPLHRAMLLNFWRHVHLEGAGGVCDEITFHQLAAGADLRAIGYDVPEPDRLYHVASRQAFIWPYDDQARLAGEHLYEDKTSLEIEEVAPADAITPARVREIHREQLAKLEAERGDRFWVLRQA